MLVNDHWTLDLEALGMAGAGDELASLVLRCHPPYAICVQGKWGAGKTSVLRYAMAKLGGEPLALSLKTQQKPTKELPPWLAAQWRAKQVDADMFVEEEIRPLLLTPPVHLAREVRLVPIWFNPWQHQHAEQPAVALLHELRAQFTHLVKAQRFAKKLAHVSVEAGLSMLGELVDTVAALQGGVKTGAGAALGSIRRVGEDYERRNFEGRPDAQRARLLFEEAVERLLAPKASGAQPYRDGRDGREIALRRLVVFIDDLDRCTEEPTVRLLEAIKLYLQTRNCVFVFGMDGKAARRAIERCLPHGTEEAQEYLEKLFQAVVHVPLPNHRESYLADLLGDGTFAESSLQPEHVAELVDELVEPNPRKLKNFVGGLAVSWRIYRRGRRKAVQDGEVESFLLINYLLTYHPDLARLLAYDPSQLITFHDVMNSCSATGAPPSAPSPAALLIHRRFRHAFEGVARADDGSGADEVVADLLERLDRAKGDRAFVQRWLEIFQGFSGEAVQHRMEPMLRIALATETTTDA